MRKLMCAAAVALFAITAFAQVTLARAAVARAAAQQQDFSKVQIKVTKVAGTVYMLEGAGGNIGVSVGEDGIVLVDDQFAPLAPRIKEALKGITDKPLRFVLNTHWHGDHTGSNAQFGAEAPIIAQENVRKRLKEGAANVAGRSVPPAPKEALPVVTFNDRASVHLNGEDIRAIHFPSGHTDGDSVIFFTQSNVVHMGDDFFSGRFPFIDLNSGGSVRGYTAAVEKILSQLPADAKIIPGHGPLSGPAELRAFANMLRETTAAVEKGIKAGKSLDQLKQEKVLQPWSKWAWEFINLDRFTEILYNDLSGKKTSRWNPHGHAGYAPAGTNN